MLKNKRINNRKIILYDINFSIEIQNQISRQISLFHYLFVILLKLLHIMFFKLKSHNNITRATLNGKLMYDWQET